MNGREFFELAVQLSSGRMPAEFRTCIGRAYYGAFHVAREFVDRECRVNLPADAACHKKLHELLEACDDELLASIGRSLAILREARNHADYRLDHARSDGKKNAITHLAISRDVIGDIEHGMDASRRLEAVDEVRSKAQTVFRMIVR